MRESAFDTGVPSFQPADGTWQDHAQRPDLCAVLDPNDSDGRRNSWIDALHRQALRGAVPLGKAVVLLDFGCGIGRIARDLAPHVGKVYAADVTPEMLARAHAAGLPSNVTLIDTDGSSVSLSDRSVDAIVTVHVLQYAVGDAGAYSRILETFARVLQPGGRCVLIEQVGGSDSVPDFASLDDYVRIARGHGLTCVRRTPIRCGRPGLLARRLVLRGNARPALRDKLAARELRRVAALPREKLAAEPTVDWLIVLRKESPA